MELLVYKLFSLIKYYFTAYFIVILYYHLIKDKYNEFRIYLMNELISILVLKKTNNHNFL